MVLVELYRSSLVAPSWRSVAPSRIPDGQVVVIARNLGRPALPRRALVQICSIHRSGILIITIVQIDKYSSSGSS